MTAHETAHETAPAPRPHQGRRAVISRDDLMAAALKLVGPHRSVSTLSLREVARQAGIAPNSFYRHFRDVDELAVALINQAGSALRQIIGEARTRATAERSVVRSSVESFMEQLRADQKYLHLLLREGTVGSDAFKSAVEEQLGYFEEELCQDLIRLAELKGTGIHEPQLVARAITRLVFAMGAMAMDLPEDQHPALVTQVETMVRMIILGTQSMATQPGQPE
ncbi:HTH-type transcriptional repressor FabR [Alcanivorax quisquiliarum]|uniref:HTH-type transcriptional repressor FabR n=1 Tax=Alcanivorax quisquiliarum TaxID=2933565 RepID=A0ABT0E7B1_9GAMM|nr:HTH-type transcriptional repressor FabR [Alcanivorax quisquiliarum]MCK0537507.1 HTH-type transcriptional repressor FabR [Alcanivorax quisquiliarum]